MVGLGTRVPLIPELWEIVAMVGLNTRVPSIPELCEIFAMVGLDTRFPLIINNNNSELISFVSNEIYLGS